MSFHHFKSSTDSSKLSEVINYKDFINEDLLDLSYLNLSELDQIPNLYLKVKKLNLTYNRFTNLSTLSQFHYLTHIFLSNNQIENFKELEKISNKEEILVLTIENNPISTHPDLISLCLLIFPRLEEINGEKITEHARQDLLDDIELSKQVILFMSKIEILLHKQGKDFKADLQNIENRSKGVAVSLQSVLGLKADKSSSLVSKDEKFSCHTKIRPYMILDLIKRVAKSIHYYLNCEVDLKTQENVSKWLSCKILLSLQDPENNELQRYLKSKVNHSDPDTCFNLQLKLFQSMKFKLAQIQNYSISLNETLNPDTRAELISSYFEETEDWTSFPIFPFNSEYLEALMLILQLQTKQVEDLYKEKQELKSLHITLLTIPEPLAKPTGPSITISPETPPHPPAFEPSGQSLDSHTTLPASPLHLSHPSQNTNKAKFPEGKLIGSSLKSKIIEMKKEVESENFRLQRRIKDLEVREKLRMEKIQQNFQENQKKMEKFRKKFEKHFRRGFECIEAFLAGRKKFGFSGMLTKSMEEGEKIQRGKKFFEIKLLKKAFGPFRYFQVYAKAQRIKAQGFYNGKILLDQFYRWKIFFNCLKGKKKAGLGKKMGGRDKENKERLGAKVELTGLLKRIISDEKSMKRLMDGLRDKKVKLSRDCACGGLRCQGCGKEKTNIIERELKTIKSGLCRDKKKLK